MQPALHISTKVLPGNKVEVSAPELVVGNAVDVFIVLTECSYSQALPVDSVMGACCINKNPTGGQQMLSEHPALNIQSDAEAIEALEAIKNYLSPKTGSLFEEMLKDALEGRIRLEATDIQDKMLVQHHAKRYVQKAIATLQRLIQ